MKLNLLLLFCVIRANLAQSDHPGIDPKAKIGNYSNIHYSAKINESEIDERSLIKSAVVIGSGNIIKYSTVGPKAVIHDDNKLTNVEVNSTVDIDSDNVIEESYIRASVTIKSKNHLKDVKVGVCAKVGSHNSIEHTEIEDGVKIGDWNNLTKIKIGKHAKLGFGNIIGSGSVIETLVEIGNAVKIDKNVQILFESIIDGGVTIGNNCTVGTSAMVGSNATLESYVYVGSHAYVAAGSVLGEQAIVENYASVDAEKIVEKNAVVIRQPTTEHLYEISAAIETIEKSKIDASVEAHKAFPNHSRFDVELNQMIEQHLRYWTDYCRDSGMMPEIVSLYLIAHDGLDKFKSERSTGRFRESEKNSTAHFVSDASVQLLTNETRREFLKMLATEENALTPSFVKGQNCQVIKEIHNGSRNIVIGGEFRKIERVFDIGGECRVEKSESTDATGTIVSTKST